MSAVALLALVAGVSGCEYSKSSNPLSPLIAEAASAVGSAPQVPRSTCGSSHAEALIACVSARYPQYLAGGVSGHQREENMAFLRDRIIEDGICGGLDLAWNLKRGVGPHSIDALAWRTPSGHIEVVDIGLAYDDASQPLQLQWTIVAGPSGYDAYHPRPDCS